MRTLVILSAVLLASCSQPPEQSSAGSEPVRYLVTFENAAHHEARISVTYTDLPDRHVGFRMSRSSPGRYALHEFGKNVYKVEAVNGAGSPLIITRPDPYQWDVAGHDGTVTLTYTLFADRAGGTYSGIDRTHAHLNMPATFMWAAGYDDRPIEVTFRLLDPEWKVATQLVPTDDPHRFTAPGLQFFMDSPTEISNFTMRTWTVSSNGKEYTLRMALHHDGSEEDADRYADMAKRVVAEQQAFFGELPEYDYGTYTFIADYLPYVSGDGMEHRDSTIIAGTRSLQENEFRQISGLSHEFVHSWNIERIRPRDLEPFDFTRANMSSSLWFGEGFTSYIGPLTQYRAGELSDDRLVEELGKTIDLVTNGPGRSFRSPVDMSRMAPFVDAATAVDPTNFGNDFVSYYPYGEVIGLALDLTLRSRFDSSLEDYMRLMWQRFGKTGIPYTNKDLQTALADVTGDAAFAEDFFVRHIFGHELPDLNALLDQAGMTLRWRAPGAATAGRASLDFSDEAPEISEYTRVGSPFYTAGLDKGAKILSFDGAAIANEDAWKAALAAHNPGDVVEVRFALRGLTHEAQIDLAEDDRLEVVLNEKADLPVTDSQLAFRNAWLGPKR